MDSDYGLEIGLHANWNDEDAGVDYAAYSVTLRDSDLTNTVNAFLGLIEASFQWGISRAEIASKIIEHLDAVIDEDIQTILDRAHDPDGE
jgi:hypothetical protein